MTTKNDPDSWAKVLRPHPAKWRGWVVENTEDFNDITWEDPDADNEQCSDVSTTTATGETVDQSEPESVKNQE